MARRGGALGGEKCHPIRTPLGRRQRRERRPLAAAFGKRAKTFAAAGRDHRERIGCAFAAGTNPGKDNPAWQSNAGQCHHHNGGGQTASVQSARPGVVSGGVATDFKRDGTAAEKSVLSGAFRKSAARSES